jgi:TonB family protein
MKNIRLALAAFVTVALCGPLFANDQQTTVQTKKGDQFTVSKMVNPSNLPYNFKRSVLNVQFSLDDNGQPQEVRVVSSAADTEVKKQVVKAFKQWRFDVAAMDKDVSSARFVLPLDIVPEV